MKLLLFLLGILAGALVLPVIIQQFIIATREPYPLFGRVRCDGGMENAPDYSQASMGAYE